MSFSALRTLLVLFLTFLFPVLIYANGPGNLDLSFGGTGFRLEGFGTGQVFGQDAVVQSDGKIVSDAHMGGPGGSFFALVRYNADGTLDTSFGNGGRFSHGNPASNMSIPAGLILQPDGKILQFGIVGGDTARRLAMARYNTNGSLDTSFGGTGMVLTGVFNNATCLCGAESAAIQQDGKILLAGYWTNFLNHISSGVIIRYETDGSLDTSFNGNGIVVTSAIVGSSVGVQPDGKVLLGGEISHSFAVARFNSNGSLDTSFDQDGIAVTTMGGISSVASIRLLADGRIVAGGRASNSINDDFALARYNADGSLDVTFNGNGKIVMPIFSGSDQISRIEVQTDGKIIAAGNTSLGNTSEPVLVRYNVDGSLDSDYGSAGKAVIDFGLSDRILSVALDSSNRAVIAGTSSGPDVFSLVTARITSDFAPFVNVSGRLTSTNGNGLGGATVVLTGANNSPRAARTSAFGYYEFAGVSSNEVYTVRVSSKRYRFQPSSQTFTLTGSLTNVDFVGDPGTESKDAKNGKEIMPAQMRIYASEKARFK